MKKTLSSTSILFLLVTTLAFNSCTKNGATGPQGAIGNANVISSTFSIPSWSYTSPYYYVNIPVANLTSSNINSAGVLVYFSIPSNSSWTALPYTQYHSPFDYYMGFNTSTNNVQITWVYDTSTSSGSDPNTVYNATVQVKVVIIPPAMVKPNVNPRNYNEVKQAYGLKD